MGVNGYCPASPHTEKHICSFGADLRQLLKFTPHLLDRAIEQIFQIPSISLGNDLSQALKGSSFLSVQTSHTDCPPYFADVNSTKFRDSYADLLI